MAKALYQLLFLSLVGCINDSVGACMHLIDPLCDTISHLFEFPTPIRSTLLFSSFSLLHVSRVQVVRMHGDMQSTLRVQFTCKDDTAVAGLDYVMTEVSCAGCHPDGACAC